jgi:putative phage-type endonuclease
MSTTAVARRDAGVFVAEANTPQWLQARRGGIAASEIAAVMGISPWESPFSLYWRKVSDFPVEVSDEMATGTRLEPVIADWWADTMDPLENLVVQDAGLFAHADRSWQLATPDRLVCSPCAACDGTGDLFGVGDHSNVLHVFECEACAGTGAERTYAVLECKWTGSWHGWGEPGSDDIPVYYRAQVLWQCDVIGVDDWHVAVLGPSGFRAYEGRRDEKDLAVMREHGQRFMDRLTSRTPPSIDEHTATITTLKKLHPDLTDDVAEISPDLAARIRRARKAKALAASLCDRYEAQLREAMGSAVRASCAGTAVASRSIFTRAEHTVRACVVDRLNYPRSSP